MNKVMCGLGIISTSYRSYYVVDKHEWAELALVRFCETLPQFNNINIQPQALKLILTIVVKYSSNYNSKLNSLGIFVSRRGENSATIAGAMRFVASLGLQLEGDSTSVIPFFWKVNCFVMIFFCYAC